MNSIDNWIASFIQELDAEQQKHVTDAMAEEKQRVLTLDELVDAVGRIQKVPDKDRIAKIVELLDEDRDGTINQVTKTKDPIHFKTGQESKDSDGLFLSEEGGWSLACVKLSGKIDNGSGSNLSLFNAWFAFGIFWNT